MAELVTDALRRPQLSEIAKSSRELVQVIQEWLPVEGEEPTRRPHQIVSQWVAHVGRLYTRIERLRNPRHEEFDGARNKRGIIGPEVAVHTIATIWFRLDELAVLYGWQGVADGSSAASINLLDGIHVPSVSAELLSDIEKAAASLLTSIEQGDPAYSVPTTSGVKEGREAFLRLLEEDPELKASWEQNKERLRERFRRLGELVRERSQAAGDELAMRHFTRPEDVDDWHHLARIVEIPEEAIRTGLTYREIFDRAIAWSDRQMIKMKLGSDAFRIHTPEPVGIPRGSDSRPLQKFDCGEMVFFDDRVTLCGVDICSGPRSQSKRKVLELLRQKSREGKFVRYRGAEIASKARLGNGKSGSAGVIRDLRTKISEALRSEANIECGRYDVIASGRGGYHFSEKLSVHDGNESANKKNADVDVGDVGNEDVGNVGNGSLGDNHSGDIVHATPEHRRQWVLQQLERADGQKLRASHVSDRFRRSLRTAERDLQALKEDQTIEFVGSTRAGYYQLRKPLGARKRSR